LSKDPKYHDQSTENCEDKSSVEIRFPTYVIIPPTMRRLAPQWRGFGHGRDESSESKERDWRRFRRLQSRYIVKEAPERTTCDHISPEVVNYPHAQLRREVAQGQGW